MYACTKSVLGSPTVTVTTGVRRGVPSSCLFFVTYINEIVRMIKQYTDPDKFLGELYTLLLMDYMVILATSREVFTKSWHYPHLLPGE